jgi:putative transposase
MRYHLWARGYWVTSSGNVTDEVWAEHIKNQTPPDDDFNVSPPKADQSGFEP